MCDNDEDYENPNFITYEYKQNLTPVIEIESDDISTTTQNNFFKETDYTSATSSNNFSNWSHHILQRPMYADDYSLLTLVKVNNFRKFLDEKKIIEINNITFYLYKFNRKFSVTARIIPREENFSVQIIFQNDKEIAPERTKIQEKMRKSKCDKNQGNLDSFCLFESNGSVKQPKGKTSPKVNEDIDNFYSKELQEILKENDIVLDLNMGIYTFNKKFFTRNRKEKLKLNIKSENQHY